MPTDNKRVAAYLPKVIKERFEAFKLDRGIKGDSPALIAILETFFGVTHEVGHSSNPPFDEEALKDELLSELRGELRALAAKIKSELLNELNSESPEPGVDRPKLRSILSNQGVDQVSLPENELPSELDEQAADEESESFSESPSKLFSKPLDGSVAWKGIELSQRLKMGAPQLSALKDNPEELARQTQKKDPDRLAWQRVGKGKYVPILDDFQGF